MHRSDVEQSFSVLHRHFFPFKFTLLIISATEFLMTNHKNIPIKFDFCLKMSIIQTLGRQFIFIKMSSSKIFAVNYRTCYS